MHLAVAVQDGEVVGGNTFFEHDGIATGYVLATRRARNRYADELLYDEVRRFCKNRGDTIFHLGGGKGGRNDSLFEYKAGFSPGRHLFHTWRVVTDPERTDGSSPNATRRPTRTTCPAPSRPTVRRNGMRIVCAGGGPAGLYFAVLAKLANPAHEITVLERNPAGVTYGWGVVFWDDLLDDLFRCDPVSARMIWDAAWKWDEYEVRSPTNPPHMWAATASAWAAAACWKSWPGAPPTSVWTSGTRRS